MKLLYQFVKAYTPPVTCDVRNFRPASKLMPVSGSTSTFGAMLPMVAGPANSISSRFGCR